MPPYRDLAAFKDRAPEYDRGGRGRLHHEIAERTANLAVATVASPGRVLDWGAGRVICWAPWRPTTRTPNSFAVSTPHPK
jgi:hypothetical protein